MGRVAVGSGLRRAQAVLLLAIAALIAGCGGDRRATASDDAPDASVDASSPSSGLPAAQRVVATASKLALKAPELAARLEPSRGAWETKGALLTSPGFRAGGVGKVGARLPLRADGALRVGLGQSEGHTLTLTPEGAREVAVEDDDGRAVYRNAYTATDVVFVATAARVEWMYLLRDETAPARFAYTLALPEGLPEVKREGAGLAFADAKGEARLHMAAPYAVDAKGVRREAQVAVEGGRLVVSVETAGLAYPVLLDPAVETGVWTQVVGPPFARSNHALAYDSARHKVVLFGGIGNSGSLNDTWEWDGTTWTNVTPVGISPPARSDHALAYDSARGKVVLFGGRDSGGTGLNDTWEWDGAAKTWTNVTPTTSPTARRSHALAYDSARGTVVLFGGYGNVAPYYVNDTWEWDGAAKTWTNVTPATNPPLRQSHALAYDSARGKVVLFGGYGSGYLNDTWEWDGAAKTWTNVTPTTNPSAREWHALAYDSARGKVVLFGGYRSVGPNDVNDTWEWDGAAKTWTNVSPATNPPLRHSHALAYDSVRGKVVLFGGHYSTDFDDTWEWNGAAQTWTNVPSATRPSARNMHALAYDGSVDKIVLFGGNGGSGALGDTWQLDITTGTWANLAPATSPSARYGHALAFDSARGKVVLFGGGYQGDTWEWDGATQTWAKVLPAPSPSARSFHALAYDSARGKVVLFGGTSGSDLADTWEWDGASQTWANVTPGDQPARA